MDFGLYSGDTSKTIYVRLRDSTTGLAKTGLVFNSAGVACYYTLPLAVDVQIPLVTLAAPTTAWASGGFVEVDATTSKGLYRLDLSNAAIASGSFTIITIEFDGVIEEAIEIPLHTRKVNAIEHLGNAVTLSTDNRLDVNVNEWSDVLLATTNPLPNAAADAAGGLPISDLGGLDLDTTDANVTLIKVPTDKMIFTTANKLDSRVDNWAGTATTISATTALPEVDAKSISNDATAADNLELMYDGTGYNADGTAPASRSQVDNIGAASGGAISYSPSSDNTSGAIVDSVVKVWATVTGTLANIESDDGTSHDFTDTANVIDHVYGFAIGGGRQAVNVVYKCNVDGNNDTMLIKVYDHVGSAWDTIATLNGTGGTATISGTPALFSKHTGTGAELGNVYIRFDTDSTTPSDLSIEILNVEAVSIGQSVGYANGAVYVDTLAGVAGTEAFVNGVADNPSNLWASAQTIAAAIPVAHFHITNGSSVTLDAATDNKEITGDEFTIAFGGRSIDNTSIHNGLVATGTFLGYPHILDTGIGSAGITGPGAKLGFCAIRGPIVSDATTYQWVLHDCWGVSAAVSEFDFGAAVAAAQTIFITSYHGPLNVSNMDHASDNLYLSGNGNLIVSASSTTGTIYLSGQWTITNNGTTTIVYDKLTTDMVATLTDTAEIGVQGAGLLDLGGMSTGMKAEVEVEANDALVAQKLDHLVAVADGDDPVDGSIMAHLASATEDWSTFVPGDDSLEALRVRGDAAWTTGGGGSITDILNVIPLIPWSVDLANTATVRVALMLINSLDDLPSTAEITPGTIDIDRKAIGGTSWSNVVSAAACLESNGQVYYDEVFDLGTGYAEGDSIRITFKSQKITVSANDYEITDATGRMFFTEVRQTMATSGATAAQVWANATRTLTTSATALAAQLSGSAITIHRGDSMSLAFTGLGDISDRTTLWFTVKKTSGDMTDATALIQITEDDGLTVINGAAAVTAANGAITVDNAVTGAVTVTLKPIETLKLDPLAHRVYDIQVLRNGTGGDAVNTLDSGTFNVNEDVTRSVS